MVLRIGISAFWSATRYVGCLGLTQPLRIQSGFRRAAERVAPPQEEGAQQPERSSVSGLIRGSLACLFIGLLLPAHLVTAADDAASAPSVDFNREVRPILNRYCLRCHGPDEADREAGLRLDQRPAATAELPSGTRAIVAGDPASSELWMRLTTTDQAERMPPVETGQTLTEAERQTLRTWIEQGAPYAEFWSFVPPRRPPLPQVKSPAWPRSPIDHFILARLEQENWAPSPEADRHQLIRRLSLDLRGLPPTPAEVQEFIDDSHPFAYERLVDRLLADPAYGERWARVWLDMARYADSRGYGSDPLRTNMWRYRDWVIDAFNQNLPYDQFTVEQLAGDLLPEATLSQRIATAFHRNTMTNTEGGTDDEEFRVAAVKDRTETTLKVWMGLTMECANCHDHKYDPISQQDYYQFYAIFNQTADADRGDESPTMPAPTELLLERIARHDQQAAELKTQIASLQEQVKAEASTVPIEPVTGRYLRIEIPGTQKILSLAEVEIFHADQNIARRGRATQSSTAFDGPAELAIDGQTNGDYASAKSTTHTATENNPWWELDLTSPQVVDRIVIWNRTDNGHATRLSPVRITLLDGDRKPVWDAYTETPPNPKLELTPRPLRPLERELQQLRDRLAALDKTRPQQPTLPVMQELPESNRRPTFLMVKGNFLSRGDAVEPRLPTRFFEPTEAISPSRLGVARWLIDPANPLTARVAVNRLWAQLFGVGLVETEEDFGTQGEAPSHPELLDWLATEYVALGWDTKQLLRTMVNSATYRQSSRVTSEHRQRDPRNRLLARAPRYRLSAETVRDQAMALSGLLVRKLNGPSVYPYQPGGLWRASFNGERTWPTSQGEDRYRRGLYTFWRRTVPYPSMQTFDAPSRELCTARRITTNTPLQALVTLNDPVYVEASQALARRLIREGGATAEDRVRFGLRLSLARPEESQRVAVLLRLYEDQLRHYQGQPDAARKLATEPLGALPADWNPAEAAAWTVVANVLLNLDGVLTRN